MSGSNFLGATFMYLAYVIRGPGKGQGKFWLQKTCPKFR